jgi:hypothetical protein
MGVSRNGAKTLQNCIIRTIMINYGILRYPILTNPNGWYEASRICGLWNWVYDSKNHWDWPTNHQKVTIIQWYSMAGLEVKTTGSTRKPWFSHVFTTQTFASTNCGKYCTYPHMGVGQNWVSEYLDGLARTHKHSNPWFLRFFIFTSDVRWYLPHTYQVSNLSSSIWGLLYIIHIMCIFI